MFRQFVLLFDTVKFLKIVQIFNRVKRSFIRPSVNFSNIPKISDSIRQSDFSPVICLPQRMYQGNSFEFLNKKSKLKVSSDWNASNKEKLWLYSLHYFNDLNAVDSKSRQSWHCDLIQRWIRENPVGFGNGWEPYPLSLRIVNWVKWFIQNNNWKDEWLESLVVQARFLEQSLEYHLLGNHLFSNAKALIFAGIYFQGDEPDKWYQSGMDIIEGELSEQVLSDGGNFELSPMYHAIFLEDLLDIVNIHQACKRDFPDSLISKIAKMMEWLECMCHPNGEIAFFNDSVLDVAPTLVELSDYAKRLNIFPNDCIRGQITHLQDSGYIRVDNKNLAVIADIAKIGPDYLPGHGHADTLSFEMSLFKKKIIVNSGISTYEPGSERDRQRGTRCHSTVLVDCVNSSEVWGGFRVAKRAKVFNVNVNRANDNSCIKFSACHDGYKKLKGRVLHCREWIISENSLKIIDIVTGNSRHEILSIFPLHPEVLVDNVCDGVANLRIDTKEIKVIFFGKGDLSVEKSFYHPEFGLSVDNNQLVYRYNGDLPSNITIKITW